VGDDEYRRPQQPGGVHEQHRHDFGGGGDWQGERTGVLWWHAGRRQIGSVAPGCSRAFNGTEQGDSV
jgi:hypothetical protein